MRENIVLALQAARGWIAPAAAPAARTSWSRSGSSALDIRPTDPEQPVRNLSGGNQQKVLLARWLITEPKLLILDEPTRGIDVGAKAQIQRLVVSLSDDGLSVLFVSAELEEVLRLSHKVAVLRERRVVAEEPNDEALTVDRLVATIASGSRRMIRHAPVLAAADPRRAAAQQPLLHARRSSRSGCRTGTCTGA